MKCMSWSFHDYTIRGITHLFNVLLKQGGLYATREDINQLTQPAFHSVDLGI